MSFGQQGEAILSVQTGHSGPVSDLLFSPDDRIIASAGTDNNVILWDVNTGKQMNILAGHTEEVTSLDFHPTEALIATGSADKTVKVYGYPLGKLVSSFDFNDPIGCVRFSSDGGKLFVGTYSVFIINLETSEKSELVNSRGINPINNISLTNDGDVIAFGGKKRNVEVFNVQTGQKLESFNKKVHDLEFDASDRYILGGSPNGQYFKKPVSGSGGGFVMQANRLWKNYYSVEVSSNYVASANRDGHISVYDLNARKVKHVLKGHNKAVRSLAISNNQQLLASAGVDRKIQLWNLNDGLIIQSLYGTGNRINDVRFTEDGEHLIIAYGNGDVRVCHLIPDGEIIRKEIPTSKFSDLINLPWTISADSVLAIADDNIQIFASQKWESRSKNQYTKIVPQKVTWNLVTDEVSVKNTRAITPKMRKYRNSNIFSLKPDFSPEVKKGNLTAYTDGDNLVIENGSEKTQIDALHTDVISSIDINPEYEIIATGSWDGTVRLFDYEGKLIFTYSTFGEDDYIFVDEANNYYASKGALDGVGFLFKDQILSFEQFDLIYNRPDLVFNEVPFIPNDLVVNYERAYNKRLEKLNIDPEKLKITQDIPILTYSSDKSVLTKTPELHLEVSAIEDSNPLDRFFIEVNGVPEFGKEGYKIEGNPYTWSEEFDIMLSEGLNEIQLYALNDAGISSLRETFKITYQKKSEKPDLYLVTIGASEYLQSEYNLTYAAKDAIDIANQFEEADVFNSVNTKVLTNKDFTIDRLPEIESFISAASVDDIVLISVAGHGILDQDLDYYLATYDMDFNNPSDRGLAYDELEDLLSKTRSRKKTLLLDACHSGELDKSEVELSLEENTEYGAVTFRAVGASVKKKEGISLQSSFELSKNLFADMRNSNGSSIISSAGGAEYAMEGSEWNNGVFTFCLLKGLKEMSADLNNDKKIMLSELQEYILNQVVEITDGKQRPTSRVENLKTDFRVW